MNDPYKEFFESVSKTLKQQTDMIVWLAERTLSVKEFKELIEKFGNKNGDDDDYIVKGETK